MPIKIAFSTVACPDWTIDQIAMFAKETGYAGVELRTLGAGSSSLASDPAIGDAARFRQVLANAGIEPCLLSTSIALHDRGATAEKQSRFQIAQMLDLAVALGCPAIRVFGYEVGVGENHRKVAQRIADRLLAVADKAGELGVQILCENAGSFSISKEWWWLMDLVDHPMVGLVWNAANAAAAGESPSVSVPTLNQRIRMAKVKDTLVGDGSGYVQLGEGNVGIESFVKRLLGVGFDGYVSVEWDRLWLPSLTPAEEYLPEAHDRLKKWLDDVAEQLTLGLGDASPFNKNNTVESLKAVKEKARK